MSAKDKHCTRGLKLRLCLGPIPSCSPSARETRGSPLRDLNRDSVSGKKIPNTYRQCPLNMFAPCVVMLVEIFSDAQARYCLFALDSYFCFVFSFFMSSLFCYGKVGARAFYCPKMSLSLPIWMELWHFEFLEGGPKRPKIGKNWTSKF